MNRRVLYILLVPILIVGLVFLVSFTPIYQRVEGSIYNVVLGLKKSIKEHPDILLVDFGDQAIEDAGTYPVSRDIYGDGIFLLKEFECLYTIFDIEFINPSPRGVDNKVLNNDIPLFISNRFSSIKANTSNLFTAISDGSLTVEDGVYFVEELNSLTDITQSDVNEKIKKIVRDNDIYLGQSAAIFGNSFFTININEAKNISDIETFNYFKEKYSYNIKIENSVDSESYTGAIPTITDISQYIKGAGFTNVLIDDDGVRRRVQLFREVDNTYFLQLAFRPLIDWYGNPDIILDGKKIILDNINFPLNKDLKRVEIPLNPDGSLNINWLPNKYEKSFKHLPFQMLIVHDKLYNKLINNIKIRSDWGYLNMYSGDLPILDLINYLESERASLYNSAEPDISTYRDTREFLLSELENYITESNSQIMQDTLDELYKGNYVDDESYKVMKEDIPEWFTKSSELLKDLTSLREQIKEIVPGSFAIIGNTATGTTDIGVNPFQKEYMNVGTHASVVNTILNNEYIKLAPKLLFIIISLISSIIITIVIKSLKPLRSILAGSFSVLLINIVLILYFRYTLTYIELLFPTLVILLNFILLTAYNFISSEKEKRFINTAFSHYLSVDVIQEIINDPSKLKLGGEQKYMTAMFTDVQGFSTFSEKLSPQELVRLLNAYLTEMSNTIMDQKGTIDKYEGDAIICFFGAPVYYNDHAYRSCLSAVIMKRVEKELNERFSRDGWINEEILTRIGINTGNFVVGNMGTSKKMDYTMMGHSVNLAARLEGVNKMYGTWIMVSEETKNLCPNSLFFRRLDRVRVVGIKAPVRLFELIEEESHLSKESIEAYKTFDLALTLFESREWLEAKKLFTQTLSMLPKDKTSKLYISRCNEFIKKEPHQDWDGVFNMSSK